MDFVKDMKAKAASMKKRLVLPEGLEPRTIAAARRILDEGLASEVTLLGAPSEVQKVAAEQKVDLKGIVLLDPAEAPQLAAYTADYYETKHKHDESKKAAGKPVPHPYTPESAKAELLDPMHFGGMMVHKGDADAMVAGALAPTAKMIKAGLNTVGTTSKTASSCFVMVCQDKSWGCDGALIFSDCAVIPDPTAEQLPDIAASAAQSCREFLGTEPVVALLSFSTKGSADSKFADVGKVQQAVELLKARKPDFLFDGELQADAALVPSVTQKKAPGSPITGKVNTLVFPNLAAGNIGYKLVQRLGNAEAFGPFLQGFKKPISDLSRGASVEDIVVTCAVTLARCQ
ncbi:MAG: phosphate acetyltransferase [Spirochaetaceae bacterium]|jgi:phosphate acetyltransferase|nr:phosphate acetyltransferase [Spirochaetaceae bacterium]